MTSLVYIGLVLTPFLLVTAFSAQVIRFCTALKLFAPVSKRSAHKHLTPHGGGILVVSVVIPLALTFIQLVEIPHATFLTVLFLASAVLAIVGWLDDLKHRSPLVRLLAHLACVGITVVYLPQLFDIVPLWVEKTIIIFAWAWFVNLYNFMDGLDGLTSSEAVFLCIAIMLFAPPLGPIAGIIGSACLGFLRINWHPAKIFIGDVGSTWLGFILGGLLLLSLEWDTWSLIYPLFTVTLVFSGDATYTLLKCLAEGHKPWVPHRKFWFHRAAKLGLRHSTIVSWVILINAILLVVAVAGHYMGAGIWTLVVGVGVISKVAWRIKILEKRIFDHDTKST